MPSNIFKGIRITGLACAIPTKVEKTRETAAHLADQDQFDVEKFIETTGVEERRCANRKQTCSDLCYEAAERLIAHKGYKKESFDGIILITQSADYETPATAHILQFRLGLPEDCMAFDINLGCSGFVYGVNIAASLIQAGSLHRVLVCCGDVIASDNNKLRRREDISSVLLFGDSGSAFIIEKNPSGGGFEPMIRTLLKADGSGYQAIITPGIGARMELDMDHLDFEKIYSHMDGPSVFEFAISKVPRAFKEFFRTFGGGIDDYDYCVFHQANRFMLEHIGKKIKLPPEKMPISMDRYGNTSSTSIPLTIADVCQREEVGEQIKFITCGFGIGLSWGIAEFSMERRDILPIIETDEYFHEAFRG